MRFSGFLSFLFTGKPFSQKELIEVRSEISFPQAIEAHLAWKRCLVDALEGQPAKMPHSGEVGDDTHCALGRWIHRSGHHRYGELPSFIALRTQHAHFHHLAREIVELSHAQRVDAARSLMAGDFQHTSHEIVLRLRHLSQLFGT